MRYLVFDCACSQAADSKAPIDKRVIQHVNYLVEEGVHSVAEMMRHLRLFVDSELCPKGVSMVTNRRYYPSRADVRKLMYRQRQRLLHGLLDQEVLAQFIDRWRQERPDDKWFYRPAAIVSLSAAGNVEDITEAKSDQSQTFLLIYQSAWQQRLLMRYGKELIFMDATYKTTKYALPMFFICIQTNCGYSVVGVIVLENEDSESLAEALHIFSSMNDNWSPKAVMLDSSDVEMKAISSTFSGMLNVNFFRNLLK